MATKEQQIAVAERVLASQGKGAWPVCGGPLSHATPRNVVEQPQPLDNPDVNGELPPQAPFDPMSAPAPDAPPPAAPLDAPAPAPEQALIVDASLDAPPPPPAPPADDAPVALADDWDHANAPAPADQPELWALHAPAPLDPVLPPLPPAPPAPPAPDPLAPLNAVNIPAPAYDTANQAMTNPAGALATLPDGVPHLSSPQNLPPGATTDPGAQGADSPNVSYLKDLWAAVQNHEISGKEALIMGLAQRGMNTPYPDQAPGPNVPVTPADPAAPPVVPPA
jgi:hypothetical protein